MKAEFRSRITHKNDNVRYTNSSFDKSSLRAGRSSIIKPFICFVFPSSRIVDE